MPTNTTMWSFLGAPISNISFLFVFLWFCASVRASYMYYYKRLSSQDKGGQTDVGGETDIGRGTDIGGGQT